jgi:hypothetical protein
MKVSFGGQDARPTALAPLHNLWVGPRSRLGSSCLVLPTRERQRAVASAAYLATVVFP